MLKRPYFGFGVFHVHDNPREVPPEAVEKQRRMEALEAHRANLAANALKSQEQFDKAIMTLSAGGIGATIAFLDKISPLNHAVCKPFLMLVWIYWGGSLMTTLLSFFSSTKALAKEAEDVGREWLSVASETELVKECAEGFLGGFWDALTRVLNACSLLFFFAGIIFFVAFIWFNFPTYGI